MENKTIKTAFRRGFTLIELMIVIVILGILMGTILPRITGAQNKAQDVGSIANVNAISQALEAYYADNGQYPAATAVGTGECLDSATGPGALLKTYMKGGLIPTPKKSNAIVMSEGTACGQTYIYLELTNGYAIATQLNDVNKHNWENNADVTLDTSVDLVELADGYTDADSSGFTAYIVTN